MCPSGSAEADVNPQLAEEWHDLESLYRDVEHKREPERIECTLRLEAMQYNKARTRIAVLVPPGYRATGPDGFLVPADLSMAGGASLPASDASGIGIPGWLLVSFHMVDDTGRSTWRPTADPRRGDNFIGYLASIESFLARGCN